MATTWAATMLAVLLEASIRVVAIAAIVAVMLHLFRVGSGAVRHAAWTSVLGAMLLMPVLPRIVPPTVIPAGFALSAPAAREQAPAIERRAAGDVALPQARASLAVSRTAGSDSFEAAPPTMTWRSRAWVPVVAAVAYAAFAVALLLRLFIGWLGSRRLARAATPTPLTSSCAVLESSAVVTPLTIGVLQPRILVPSCWREWPTDKVRAVLAHELAHVRRRDPLVTCLAHVNRCVFWFHPVAWWLKRQLAATAEHACDDAAVAVTGESRAYAQILLDFAETVRTRGGRLSFEGLGVDGRGLLGQRVDRILRGDGTRAISRTRRAVVALTCALTIVGVASCRRQAEPVMPLQPDPEVTKHQEQQRAEQEFYRRAGAMTATEVNALEASLKGTPGDLETIKTLKAFYTQSGQKVFGWNEMVRRRLPHILWLIANHPEHQLAAWPISASADPAGYAAAARAWQVATSQQQVSGEALVNAAFFFTQHEPARAEQLLLQASTIDPEARTVSSPTGAGNRPAYWAARLGSFYGHVIVGPRNPRDGSPLRKLADDPYAQGVIARLLESSDAKLLAAAGAGPLRAYNDPERHAAGRRILERALALDPDERQAAALLAARDRNDQVLGRRQSIRAKQAELAGGDIARKLAAGERLNQDEQQRMSAVELDAIATLPDNDRFPLLIEFADTAYMVAEYQQWVGKRNIAERRWEQSKKAAQDVLAMAPRLTGHPDYAIALYRANIALGAHALREGDRKKAVEYMREAAHAPASEGLANGPFVSLDSWLVNYLLDAGERESVASFLERAAELRKAERDRLLKDAAAIRAGRMPGSYQHMVARRQ